MTATLTDSSRASKARQGEETEGGADVSITTKRQMYAMLAAGAFGNTVPAFDGLDAWLARSKQWSCPLWGVRSFMSGDPRMRLDLPTAHVPAYCRTAFGSDRFTVSPMVDQWLTYRAEVFDSPQGLVCRQVIGHRELKWRQAFARHGYEVGGSVAAMMIRHFLNGNSFDDLMDLFDRYPGHVVELTAMERCYGTLALRNAVVWEVRDGISGGYERNSGWWIGGAA